MSENTYHASSNRTYISLTNPDDEVDVEKMKLLKKYNTEQIKSRNLNNKENLRKEDRYITLDAIASTLKLTDSQKKEAHRIFKNLESKQRGMTELSFAVCVIVVNQDVEGKRYWVNMDGNDPLFEDFVEDHDLNPLPSLCQIKREVDYV
jgi:transcription initiation factor TFIIIB Brf1 subunit/transcription initiation factor TFIIB